LKTSLLLTHVKHFVFIPWIYYMIFFEALWIRWSIIFENIHHPFQSMKLENGKWDKFIYGLGCVNWVFQRLGSLATTKVKISKHSESKKWIRRKLRTQKLLHTHSSPPKKKKDTSYFIFFREWAPPTIQWENATPSFF